MTFNTNNEEFFEFFEKPEYKTILLKQIKLRLRKAISPHMLVNMKIDISRDIFYDSIVSELLTYVMKESLKEETLTLKHKQPKTSWQMFKQEWFPKWLLKGFPIEYKIIEKKATFEAYEVYPQLPQVYDTGHHFTEIQVRSK